MSTVEDGHRILRDAERGLRELIERAVEQQRYGDVSEIAKLADGISKLTRQLSPQRPATVDRERVATSNGNGNGSAHAATQRKAAVRLNQKGSYPRFERDGDRLIKVGWSKKNNEAYEHRAPRHSVIAFVRHLARHVDRSNFFSMETLLPIPDVVNGGELPAYQAYMTLAWLRQAGAIEKKGRDGYILRMTHLVDEDIDTLWDQLPTRSA